MNYDEMLSITEQFENMGLLYDTGKRAKRQGRIHVWGAFVHKDGRTLPLYATRAGRVRVSRRSGTRQRPKP